MLEHFRYNIKEYLFEIIVLGQHISFKLIHNDRYILVIDTIYMSWLYSMFAQLIVLMVKKSSRKILKKKCKLVKRLSLSINKCLPFIRIS